MDSEYSFEEGGSSSSSGAAGAAGGGGGSGGACEQWNKPRTGSSSSRQSGKSFSCTICGGQFSRQAILNEHVRAEHYQERVNCTICGKPFKRQNDRRRHETFQHLRKRAFQCKIGGFGCGKRFTRMDSLREHQANPKKAGTTCEQAMLFAKAAPQPVPPPPPPPLPLPQPLSLSLTSLPPRGSSEPDPFVPMMPGVQVGGEGGRGESVVDQSHDLDPRLSPSAASDSQVLATSRELRSWLDWQMELPERRSPDPSLMPANISWPSVPEPRLRHTAVDLAASLSARLSSGPEMPPLQRLVVSHHHHHHHHHPHQDLVWNMPEPTTFDESSMWSPWNWVKTDGVD